MDDDRAFLALAIEQARIGRAEGGVPIGGALVVDGRVVGVGRNRRVQQGSAIRHGVKNDSRMTLPEIFDAPTRRSTKMIGTSPTVQPASRARNSVSTWNE